MMCKLLTWRFHFSLLVNYTHSWNSILREKWCIIYKPIRVFLKFTMVFPSSDPSWWYWRMLTSWSSLSVENDLMKTGKSQIWWNLLKRWFVGHLQALLAQEHAHCLSASSVRTSGSNSTSMNCIGHCSRLSLVTD